MLNKIFAFFSRPQQEAQAPLSPTAEKLIRFLADHCKAKGITNPSTDNVLMERLKRAAREAEKDLARGRDISIQLPFIGLNQNHPVHLDIVINVSQLK